MGDRSAVRVDFGEFRQQEVFEKAELLFGRARLPETVRRSMSFAPPQQVELSAVVEKLSDRRPEHGVPAARSEMHADRTEFSRGFEKYGFRAWPDYRTDNASIRMTGKDEIHPSGR